MIFIFFKLVKVCFTSGQYSDSQHFWITNCAVVKTIENNKLAQLKNSYGEINL